MNFSRGHVPSQIMAPTYPKLTPQRQASLGLEKIDGQRQVWVVTTVHGAEAALCWVCSGLGKGTHLATLLLTAHLDPGFKEKHSVNHFSSFLDSAG